MIQDDSENLVREAPSTKSWKTILIQFLILFVFFFGLISCYHLYREAQRQAGHSNDVNIAEKAGGVSNYVLVKHDHWNWIASSVVAGFLISAGALASYACWYRWYYLSNGYRKT
ncbi:uncharacterized protein KLLA0_F28105g [Kluyveromyces lactis]|uniref:KLLA0F28105p n=1 Tax=Kluyveromyces lactis (strain ATCC 8585 / CBS 2359 / DSM 70799 / NBRC 1267 / NRRL Y-1140 / WM37) TaxID=284590 RepID=Q6CIB0_KLULA|nr:uncharacterized protein KLLA0_F28105g [Kluyveromyces lactis]CAG99038.1 KLLA0F28105p [Kluyveromyces lactis]|eukprot:XP_456329.1 uncharacterized protein KLLA0_F28105g [Kluyveromyces lactis]